VKGAWKHYLWNGALKANASYRKHLRAAASDFGKLERLTTAEASHVGLLLLGFDTLAAPMKPEIDDLAERCGLTRGDWHCRAEAWQDPHVAGHRTNVWLWTRFCLTDRFRHFLRDSIAYSDSLIRISPHINTLLGDPSNRT
jgi:hypothetical protein